MAETQYFPSITQSGVPVVVNGVEVQTSDLMLMGQTAGLADDRVLAELLRIMPTDGTHIARAIIPAGVQASTMVSAPGHNARATVAPSGNADGSIIVNPFRAIVGTRAPVGTNATQNWRDIRSSIFVGSATTLAQTVALSANSSGNPRWDLVFAALSVDAPAGSVTRRIKDPNSGAPAVTPINQYLASSVTIAVLAGTPASSPTLPALPSDSGSTYMVPLAYVLVPTGFVPTSTVAPEQIRDVAPALGISAAAGGYNVRPASYAFDTFDPTGTPNAGGYAADPTFAWQPASPYRKGLSLPSSMQGAEARFFDLDLSDSGHQSAASGAVLDASIDWRNRFFRTQAFVTSAPSLPFANDPTASAGGAVVPHPIASGIMGDGRHAFSVGQSFVADNAVVTGQPTVFYDAHAAASASGFQVSEQYPSGFSWAITVDLTTGFLLLFTSGTNSGCRMFVFVDATAQMANYKTGQP